MSAIDSLRAMASRMKSTADFAAKTAEEKEAKALVAASASFEAHRTALAAREHAIELRLAVRALMSEIEGLRDDDEVI